MKKILTLGSIVLACCLFAAAQTSGYSQSPSGSSASGYSQNQTGNSQSFSSNSPDQFNSTAESANQKTTVQGCLSQSADGAFMLSDASGTSYQLNDGSSRLAQFVGKEIRVDGFGLFTGTTDTLPGAMTARSSELKGPVQQIDVTRVRKIADTCQTRSGNK